MADDDPWALGPGADRRADERATLSTYLDYLRDAVVRTVEGLSEDDAHRSLLPSGWTPVGLLSHLADDESSWFRDRFAGEDLPVSWTEDDPDADWRAGAALPLAEAVAAYRRECERSRAVVAAHGLDDVARRPERSESLRWVLLHMIAETARHAGHIDVVRELLDGTVGE